MIFWGPGIVEGFAFLRGKAPDGVDGWSSPPPCRIGFPGFTVVDGTDGEDGGGIKCVGGTFVNCIIRYRRAGWGGSGDWLADPGAGGNGGGFYAVGPARFINCILANNQAGQPGFGDIRPSPCRPRRPMGFSRPVTPPT